jgi:hypothetical protein
MGALFRFLVDFGEASRGGMSPLSFVINSISGRDGADVRQTRQAEQGGPLALKNTKILPFCQDYELVRKNRQETVEITIGQCLATAISAEGRQSAAW